MNGVLDCSLQVYELLCGENVIGIMQGMEAAMCSQPLSMFSLGKVGQHLNLATSTTITLRVLMTREQKVIYAVMQRLMNRMELSVDMHNRGKYIIHGTPTLSAETLKEFAEKKHAQDEVEFVFENASLEIVKERKHVKTTVH